MRLLLFPSALVLSESNELYPCLNMPSCCSKKTGPCDAQAKSSSMILFRLDRPLCLRLCLRTVFHDMNNIVLDDE